MQNYILVLSSLFISFIVFEIGLRILGMSAGFVGNLRWFHPEDNLQTLHGFTADSLGITKIDQQARNIIEENIKANKKINNIEINSNYLAYEVYSLGNDYIEKPDNNFFRFLSKIEAKTIKSDLDSAIIKYSKSPINEHGFKSIPFRKYTSITKKILLIGDSFTWGHSTMNKTNSFADELLAKGYTVYNTGITATDPAQYLTIAKHYIPRLKPDVVIVNFFMGNDVVYYNREMIPYQPVFYATNAGNLMACPQGVYFADRDEAYQYQFKMQFLPTNNTFNYICSKSSVGTLLWRFLRQKGWVCTRIEADKIYDEGVKNATLDYPYSNLQIKEIEDICKANRCQFILSVFPDINSFGKWIKPDDVPRLFEKTDYYMKSFEKKEYNLENNHMNDLGNLNYSIFLDSLIQHGK